MKAINQTGRLHVTLLNKDLLKLVVLGFVVTIPVAWYAMNQWLFTE